MVSWDRLIEHLPPTSRLDECWVAYKPWLKDRSHHWKAYVRWFTGPVDSWGNKPWTWREAFGSTSDEALNNLTDKMSDEW